MTADELDTVALREKFGSGGTWWAERIMEMRGALLTALDEVDRLRAAGGVQPAPAAERHEPTLGTWTWGPPADASHMFCRCGVRFDDERVHTALSAAGSTDQPPAETCGYQYFSGSICDKPFPHLLHDDPPGGTFHMRSGRYQTAGGSTDGAGTTALCPERKLFSTPINAQCDQPAGHAGQHEGVVSFAWGNRDWTREPTIGELGIAGPPQLGPDDYPEDHGGRDPHCGIVHPHSRTSRCAGD